MANPMSTKKKPKNISNKSLKLISTFAGTINSPSVSVIGTIFILQPALSRLPLVIRMSPKQVDGAGT